MITFPNAKINLGLYVERKREDGYHDLSTVFYPIPLTDAVEVVEAKETALFTYGNPVDCPPEKNLVMKAYRLMEEEFKLPPVAIHLYKHIPDGAGLGGGSSDATSVAKILNSMFALGLSEEEIAVRVKRLGADCPFFAYNRPRTPREQASVHPCRMFNQHCLAVRKVGHNLTTIEVPIWRSVIFPYSL